MHHLYPSVKGDPLCPLGFHPQVRWPTRCKRCFRDYKEHGGRKKDDDLALRRDDTTASSPSLSSWSTPLSRTRDDGRSSGTTDSIANRTWTSSSTLANDVNNTSSSTSRFTNRPASWTSTPDLGHLNEDTHANVISVNLTLPRRKPSLDTGQNLQETVIIRRPSLTESNNKSTSTSISKTETASKLQPKTKKLVTKSTEKKDQDSVDKEKARRIKVKELKASVEEPTNHDVQFLIQVKSKAKQNEIKGHKDLTGNSSSKKDSSTSSGSEESSDDADDSTSTAGTETTDTTLVGHEQELEERIRSLKQELETTRARCDRLEKEKSDIMLRRIGTYETTASKTSEVLKLQQRVNELQSQSEDLRDEKKSLSLRVKELEEDLESRPTTDEAKRVADELRAKLVAAETLCEELMDENEDMKKELRDLEEEIEEMQDNFREDQADEYSSLKKELEQTTKNCRILSFKLRKTERKNQELENEKVELDKKLAEIAGGQNALNSVARIKHLEQELKIANEVAVRVQKELDETNAKLAKAEENNQPANKKKTPMLGSIAKTPSAEGKVSRASLTRGGSQEDPAQLLRDLQDSLEREADLREQLRFAEEEAQSLRRKASRVEDDNESLVLQLKKMATKARSRKLSPTPRLSAESSIDKDEGISEEDDPAELRLQLELNEQETTVLRRKVEDLDREKEMISKKVKDLQDKLAAKTIKKSEILSSVSSKTNKIEDQKAKVLEEEISELRMKLIEKERDCERLHAELSLTQKRSKGPIVKSKSLDLDQQTVDLKRQLQVIEQEATVLRNKTQTLEADNEKLGAENKRLQLLKGTKKLQSDKSVEVYVDKIANLEIELNEANNKVNELKAQLEKNASIKKDSDTGDKKKLKEEIDKLKKDLTKVETERDSLSTTLKRLKDESIKLKPRTPKKPTDFTTKLQMKKMVEDLENEISEILVLLKNSEKSKSTLEEQLKAAKSKTELDDSLKELEEMKKKLAKMEKELLDEKNKANTEKTALEGLITKTESSIKKLEDDNKKLLSEKEKLKEENNKLVNNNSKLDGVIKSLNEELKTALNRHEEIASLTKKLQEVKSEMEVKDKQIVTLKRELEFAEKAEKDKAKLIKDVGDKTKKMSELEKKLKEADEKLKRNEKMLATKKERVTKLEKDLEKAEECNRYNLDIEKKNKETIDKLTSELETIKSSLTDANCKINVLESTLTNKNNHIDCLETTINAKDDQSDSAQIQTLSQELSATKSQLSELQALHETSEKVKATIEEKIKKLETEYKTERSKLESKAGDLEIDLQAERKKIERIKTNHEKEQKNRELELESLRSKIRSLEQNSGLGSKKLADVKNEFQLTIDQLNAELIKERHEYEDLTAKYEILEEEHVVTKAQLVTEKEMIASKFHDTQQELTSISSELKALRETYNTKQDAWIKERLDMQEKLKALEEKVSRSDTSALEGRNRMKSAVEEKNLEIEQLKRKGEEFMDQMNYLRKENDDLKKKLDDYEKVAKIQRNISADSSALDKEMKALQTKYNESEKARKTEVAQCKMRYEGQINVLSDELQSIQAQVTRFKRERDTFKHMLESAQKTMGELKSGGISKSNRENTSSISSYDEMEEAKSKIATLEQQISCMEDELSEARLEGSKLKTELVSERSSWEIKLSEMQSRLNELEEDRLISTGRTKIPGLRTRMELAWHKEREEQQRLLQETSTLARDLRQTLFEVERERDKERLEAKRKQDQLKKSIEEEQDENRKKINDIQCDLLELRDAHAKLRTTNEKLRREKERHEKEREELKSLVSGRRKADQEEDKKIASLLAQVDELMKLAPELFPDSNTPVNLLAMTPTPPRRTKGSKSRESSPAFDRRSASKEPSPARMDHRTSQLQSTLQRLTETTEELRRLQRLGEAERDKERAKRHYGMRRAASTENDNTGTTHLRPSQGLKRNGMNGNGSLRRKSLSLEQTSAQNDQVIWKADDDSLLSLQSLDAGSENDSRFFSLKRDSSLDSRLSGGSTQSEILPSSKKKKKGIIGKLKQLTKSHSIDDTTIDRGTAGGNSSETHGSGSDISVGEDIRSSKSNLKGRITGMFKKSGSSSRSHSLDRRSAESLSQPDSSSMQRPLTAANFTRASASPAPSDDSSYANKAVQKKSKLK